MFFCGRSDYFKAVIEDHFGETSQYIDNLPVIVLHDVTTQVFLQVVYYIYQDSCQEVSYMYFYKKWYNSILSFWLIATSTPISVLKFNI